MKLYYDRRSNDPIYYIQQGIRNGKKTTTKNVKRIGKHSELLAITDNPLEYAKAEVAKLNDEFKNGQLNMTLSVDFTEKLSATGKRASASNSLNIGYMVLQKIYHYLDVHSFFSPLTADSREKFDCNEVNRFLTFARILSPCSKLSTFDKLDTYYERPDIAYQHILRFLDVLANHSDAYIEHLFHGSEKVVPRNTSVCYFDCTNYYFEIENEDPDYVDEVTGEVIRGLRRYGPSKEHRPNPLVQMGLFMDGSGVPISMCINSGSDNEQKCAVPMERKITRMFAGKKFIYCADAGLGSLDIRQFNSMGGRAFIVTQSVKKLSNVLQDAVFNDYDYRLLSSDKPVTIDFIKNFDRCSIDNRSLYDDVAYKVLEADKAVDLGLYETQVCKNGKVRKVKSKANLKQYVIVTFSRKMMEYQRHIRNAQIERAMKLLSSGHADQIKKGPHDVTRFIKRTSCGKNGEEAIDTYAIDEDVIAREEKYDGYYAVATNLDDDVRSILSISSRRYKIEDCFRVLKSNFSARPVYHHKESHIKAHFLVCYTALLIYRLLEVKLEAYGEHFTTEEILHTLQNMNVTNIEDMFYTANYTGSDVCTALNGVFDLGLDKKFYLPKDLNKKFKNLLG